MIRYDVFPVLEESNIGRNWLLNIFQKEITPIFLGRNKVRLGVVGGSYTEPEIRELNKLKIDLHVSTLGIEASDFFLDLNSEFEIDSKFDFDLLLCSQVFEHIWNHGAAFETLFQLTSFNGYVWINVPASNRMHGSPDFYSAGFTSEYLSENLRRVGFKVISSGSVGTQRNYLATHMLPYWLSVKAHSQPILTLRHDTSLLKNFYLFLRYLPTLLMLQFTSTRINFAGRYTTESWALAFKSSE